MDTPADEVEQKAKSDDFMKALLTQVVCDDKELEDYMPRYANPAINFATDDMGSDKAMGGVLLDILIVIIAFIFCSDHQQHDREGGFYDRNTESFRLYER